MVSSTHLVRFVAYEDNQIHYGQLIDTLRDIGLDSLQGLEIKAYRVDGGLLENSVTGDILTVSQLLSPLETSDCSYIRCIGMNYLDHAEEIQIDLPTVPDMFTKPRTALSDPHPKPLSIPRCAQDGTSDYEGELCVVIGKSGCNIAEKDALTHVLGYTVANDVSARQSQMKTQQWSFSKGFNGSCPIGPVLVSSNALSDPGNLALTTRYNGETVQDGNTRNLVFSVPKLVAFLSKGTTLEAGSLILTGTPSGVGFKRNPKIVLRDGDEVRIHIDQIGTLINTVRYEDW